jgi:hypothetical protein
MSAKISIHVPPSILYSARSRFRSSSKPKIEKTGAVLYQPFSASTIASIVGYEQSTRIEPPVPETASGAFARSRTLMLVIAMSLVPSATGVRSSEKRSPGATPPSLPPRIAQLTV